MSSVGTPPPPPASGYSVEDFTDEERVALDRHFTSTTGPVFAIFDLPEVVKGALFARYSRSNKSLRRLFLDEFAEPNRESPPPGLGGDRMRWERAEDLYERVFTEYGDDSVAQLGSAHLACEQASNVLTKVLEWGRLASYLEQSTRYLFYDRRLGGRYRYLVPAEVAAADLAPAFEEVLDGAFTTYSSLAGRLTAYYEAAFPRRSGDSEFAHRAAIRAKVCDDLRGLLPAATLSNVGIHGSGQAFEMLLIRMLAHPLDEVRHYAGMMLIELRKVIPSFLRRVDMEDRGRSWTRYLAETARRTGEVSAGIGLDADSVPEVALVDWDPDGERKVAAGALYAASGLADDQLARYVASLDEDGVGSVLSAYFGERGNRRHKPGRALERTGYRFDILCDYGIFRDLQRHRLLTIEWQRLDTRHGYVTPVSISEIGATAAWDRVMEQARDMYRQLQPLGADVAQYAVPFAYRIRFFMQLNAREAFHLIELRTAPAGHPGYRRVCQEMHRLIAEEAGHSRLAAAMCFADHGAADLERLDSEQRAAARRAAAGLPDPALD